MMTDSFLSDGWGRMKEREGDIAETRDGVLFDVKGLVHPSNRVVAFIRYFPDRAGDRSRNGKAYGKVYSLSARYALLKERFPWCLVYDQVFDETLCEVPVADIERLHQPAVKLSEIRGRYDLIPLMGQAVRFAELLKEEAHIPWNSIGLSGSILVGLQTPSSDIDPIVYGSENCRRAYSALRRMLNHAGVDAYNSTDLKRLFDFRSKDTKVSFEDFVRTESRKVMQGKFLGTDYFVRFVKEWNEIEESYGDIQYKNVGRARIAATIVDDSEAIFTPCTYKIEDVKQTDRARPELEPIGEIVSFRGRFCEQAVSGENVVAQGKVERVTDVKRKVEWFRLLVGSNPSDFIILER
jgi:predicted nucleotidyltransferase